MHLPAAPKRSGRGTDRARTCRDPPLYSQHPTEGQGQRRKIRDVHRGRLTGPDELRNIIEGGPPEGILSRFNDMFKEKEEATHLRAAEVMRELGWDATD